MQRWMLGIKYIDEVQCHVSCWSCDQKLTANSWTGTYDRCGAKFEPGSFQEWKQLWEKRDRNRRREKRSCQHVHSCVHGVSPCAFTRSVLSVGPPCPWWTDHWSFTLGRLLCCLRCFHSAPTSTLLFVYTIIVTLHWLIPHGGVKTAENKLRITNGLAQRGYCQVTQWATGCLFRHAAQCRFAPVKAVCWAVNNLTVFLQTLWPVLGSWARFSLSITAPFCLVVALILKSASWTRTAALLRLTHQYAHCGNQCYF